MKYDYPRQLARDLMDPGRFGCHGLMCVSEVNLTQMHAEVRQDKYIAECDTHLERGIMKRKSFNKPCLKASFNEY